MADLDSPEAIAEFVDAFYERVLSDPELAPLFTDVAGIDIREHFPRIRAYWEKLLLGHDGYHRHTMNLHRALHAKQALRVDDFERWLRHFTATVDAGFQGPGAERAKRLAAQIALNMRKSLQTG